MCDGERGGLLRKLERKFPDENDGGVNEDGKRSVLIFAGEICADPRIRTEQRPVTFAPTARDIGEDGQDRQLIIVVPKNEWVAPKQQQTKCDNNYSSERRAKKIWPRINTDFHGCRKKNLLIRVSSVFIRGQKSHHHRFSLVQYQHLVFDAMFACRLEQTLERFVHWFVA